MKPVVSHEWYVLPSLCLNKACNDASLDQEISQSLLVWERLLVLHVSLPPAGGVVHCIFVQVVLIKGPLLEISWCAHSMQEVGEGSAA